jgi:hypothetical protein
MGRGFDLRYGRHWVAFVSHRWLLNVDCLQIRLILDPYVRFLCGLDRNDLGDMDQIKPRF